MLNEFTQTLENQKTESSRMIRNLDENNEMPTMYNRNYGGFDYVRIHSELLTLVLNRKTLSLIP